MAYRRCEVGRGRSDGGGLARGLALAAALALPISCGDGGEVPGGGTPPPAPALGGDAGGLPSPAPRPSEATRASSTLEVCLEFRRASGPAASGRDEPPASDFLFAVVEQRRLPEPPPRQRNPELAADRLAVAAVDEHGKELARAIVADPRLLRAEAPGPSGVLSGSIHLRESGRFTVALRDDPRTRQLLIYQPRWTGKDFLLEVVAKLPVAR